MKKVRYYLLYGLFAFAFIPGLISLTDILQLQQPVKNFSSLEYLMVSPTILVFDRPTYFAQFNFEVTYADLTTQLVPLDARFFEKLWPFPVSSFVVRTLGRGREKQNVLSMIDLLFCRRLVPGLSIRPDVTKVILTAYYIPTNSTSKKFELICP